MVFHLSYLISFSSRRKLPKLRSARATVPEEKPGATGRAHLTAAAVEKILISQRSSREGDYQADVQELTQQFEVEETAMASILRYYSDLPQYKLKRRELSSR